MNVMDEILETLVYCDFRWDCQGFRFPLMKAIGRRYSPYKYCNYTKYYLTNTSVNQLRTPLCD